MNSTRRQFKQFALLMAQLLVFIASFVCFPVDLHSETLLDCRDLNRELAQRGDNRIYFYDDFYYGRILDFRLLSYLD